MIARCIDFETTGTPDDQGAEVIEVGSVDVDVKNMQLGNPYRSFAKPKGPISPITKAVHHITEADVADAPPIDEVWPQLFKDMSPGDVLVAHNAGFEKHFCPLTNYAEWIDTYKVARVVYPDEVTHSLYGLKYALGLTGSYGTPHRALPDAYMTGLLFLHLLYERPVDEMVKISKHPVLLRVMNFGKHKGMTFEAAPLDYLDWLAYKSEMDEDTKFTALYWIKRRKAMGEILHR